MPQSRAFGQRLKPIFSGFLYKIQTTNRIRAEFPESADTARQISDESHRGVKSWPQTRAILRVSNETDRDYRGAHSERVMGHEDALDEIGHRNQQAGHAGPAVSARYAQHGPDSAGGAGCEDRPNGMKAPGSAQAGKPGRGNVAGGVQLWRPDTIRIVPKCRNVANSSTRGRQSRRS